MSQSPLMKALNMNIDGENEGDDNTVKVEVEVEVAQAATDAVEEEQALVDVEEVADASDSVAQQADDVEAADAIVAEEGLTPTAYFFLKRMGIIDAAESFGIAVVGQEGLNAGSRNEEYVAKIREACELSLKELGKRIIETIRAIARRIKELIMRVVNAVTSFERSVTATNNRLKEVGELDKDKMKRKVTALTAADMTVCIKAAEDGFKAADDLSKAAQDNKSVTKDTDVKVAEQKVKEGSAAKPKEVALSTFTPSGLAGQYASIMKLLSTAAAQKKNVAAIEAGVKAAESSASVLERSTDASQKDEAATARKQIEYTRKHMVEVGKVIAGAIRNTNAVCRSFNLVGNALVAARKG